MRNFAERLLDCETSGDNEHRASDLPATFRVCEKLRGNLVCLMGRSGFAALLTRALVLAGVEISWLRTVRTKADGSLDGLEEIRVRLPAEQIAEGGVVLVARLLGLLVVFVGEDLTRQLLRRHWPTLSVEDLELDKGDKNENTK
jgi:hypothetical protein